jgi:hypothetical protein
MGAAGFTPGGFPFGGAVALRAGRTIRAPKKAAYRADPDGKTGVDAGREDSAITLGKRAQMPYVWPPRRDRVHASRNDEAGRRHSSDAKGKWVAVPNPLKNLG